MNLKIGVIKGDGIGPEIVTEAMKVLDKVGEVYGHTCEYEQLLMGGASTDGRDSRDSKSMRCSVDGIYRRRC